MNRIIYLLTILLISCSSIKNDIDEKPEISTIEKDSLRVTPPLVDYDNGLDITNRCNVYQYIQKDSLNKNIAKKIEYYSNGKIAKDKYTGYKTSTYISNSDATYLYDYKDGLKIQKRMIKDNKVLSKTILHYNKKSQLIKEVRYNLERRMRSDVYKGITSPDGCIVTDEDYEKKPSWKIESIIHYQYDSSGRKTEYYAPSVHWSSQNRYTWTYNNYGKILEYRSYEHDRLIWVQKYSYSDTNYQYTLTWYDREGQPKHLKEKKHEYTPQKTHYFKLDKNGSVIEESVTTEKNEILNRTTTQYNEDGLIAKVVRYNKENNPEVTHLYEYLK